MKKFYQTEWQGINFRSFVEPDDKVIAGPDFYESFYREFFRRYKDWGVLDPQWLASKARVATIVFERLSGTEKEILSIGYGLGAVEKRLCERGVDNLDVAETSAQPLQWLRQFIGDNHVFIGLFPACVPADRRYDLVYLSAVDYCFDDDGLSTLLRDVHSRLEGGGRCLIVSASFDPEGFWRGFKYRVRMMLHSLGIWGPRGQLWGYLRTRKDYLRAMQGAGFKGIMDGLTAERVYWIEGKKLD